MQEATPVEYIGPRYFTTEDNRHTFRVDDVRAINYFADMDTWQIITSPDQSQGASIFGAGYVNAIDDASPADVERLRKMLHP